jgi:FMN-dependent NADH-azoreductase
MLRSLLADPHQMNLLHLDASIQGDDSISRVLSRAMAARFLEAFPKGRYLYRDLAAAPLPHVTLERLASAEAHAVLEEFLHTDVVIIGAPMYNFALASQLKTWLDHILIAGHTFRYEDGRSVGLTGDKRVLVAHSRGGIYPPDADDSMEHAETYLRSVLRFIGVNNPEFVVAEGTRLGEEARNRAVAGALQAISDLRIKPNHPVGR